MVLLAPVSGRARAIANAYLAASSALLYPRHHLGTDGSDQVSFQSSAVAFVARATSERRVQDAAIWYLAIQSGLSYAVSGWVKLFGASWRSGLAVPGVMRTVTYGNRRLWTLVKDRPRLARTAAHAMLAGEGLFPLVFLARGRLTRPFLLWAGCFHTFIGLSMGLGRFVTAFGSMLPAVAFVTNDRPKSALVPKLAMAAGGGILASGAVAAVLRKARLAERAQLLGRMSTSAGNELVYVRSECGGSDGSRRPVLVLEHGMISTPQHFSWITETMSAGIDVITYWRAGYGPSKNQAKACGVEDSAADLADLLASLPEGTGPVFVGGHSLGGLIARKAAERADREISGIVYVDSSHPAQLARSPQQRAGAQRLSQAFTAVSGTLRFGLGWLLERPAWVTSLPEAVRGAVVDQYRDSRLWSAGLKEWQSALGYFDEDRNHNLKRLEIPALVVSAEATVTSDEHQNALNDDLVASHGSEWVTQLCVRNATHDSLLTNRDHAADVAGAIGRFLQQVLTR